MHKVNITSPSTVFEHEILKAIQHVNFLLVCRQHPMYNGGELRWQQPNPTPGGPYLAYPILSSPQPPVSNDYAYYQIMPAPCPPVMGFYQPFPGTYAGPVQAGVVNPVSADVSERPLPLGPAYGMASQRGRGMVRSNVLPKVQKMKFQWDSVTPLPFVICTSSFLICLMRMPFLLFFLLQQHLGVCQPPRGRRPPTRSVAVQKEVCTLGPDGRTKTVMLVDAAQQTGKNKATITKDSFKSQHTGCMQHLKTKNSKLSQC